MYNSQFELTLLLFRRCLASLMTRLFTISNKTCTLFPRANTWITIASSTMLPSHNVILALNVIIDLAFPSHIFRDSLTIPH